MKCENCEKFKGDASKDVWRCQLNIAKDEVPEQMCLLKHIFANEQIQTRILAGAFVRTEVKPASDIFVPPQGPQIVKP